MYKYTLEASAHVLTIYRVQEQGDFQSVYLGGPYSLSETVCTVYGLYSMIVGQLSFNKVE